MEFFDALVTLGLLDRDAAGRYISPPDCARYLNRSSADYIGGILEHLNSRMYGTWSKLGSALRSGLPQSGALGDGGYTALYETELALDHFLRAMTASSMLVATSLAAAFPWNSVRSFADIGAAQGCVACEIAKAHPHLTGIGFDLPQVGTAFTRYVAERSLTQRLAFAAGDFMTVTCRRPTSSFWDASCTIGEMSPRRDCLPRPAMRFRSEDISSSTIRCLTSPDRVGRHCLPD
jgi:hypothetical protein